MQIQVGVHVVAENLLVMEMKDRLLDERGFAPRLDVGGATPGAVMRTVALRAPWVIIRTDVMQSGLGFERLL